MIAGLEKIDIALFYLINQSGQNAVFEVLMPFMSNLKNFYIPLGLVLLFLIIQKGVKCRSVAVGILLLIGVSEWVSSDALKPAFDRPRPYHAVSGVHLYDRMQKTWSVTPELETPIRGQSRSLPSSHATNIFAAAFFFSYFFRRFWPFFYLIALTVGYSRVYLGVHFPLDVVAGAIAGTGCAYVMARATRSIIGLIEKRLHK